MPVDFDISPVIPPVHPTEVPAEAPPTQPLQPAPVPQPIEPSPVMPKKSKSNQLLKWLVLAAVGLFVVTIASLWLGGPSFSDKGVILTLEAPDHATSGDEVTYTISYRNDTKVDLTGLSFRLFYPEDSTALKEGKPAAVETEGFTVERLASGESGKKEFTIYMVGDKGTIKTAHVHLIYTPGALKSSFEKDATVSTTITELPAALTLVAPPTSVSGQPVQYILDIRNDGQSDLADLKAVLKYPDGFTVQKMQPQPSEGNTIWHLDKIQAGEGIRITVNGVLTGNERETKNITATLQHTIGGQYVDFVRTTAFTMLSSPLLSVTMVPNDSRDYVSFAGDKLRYAVRYANNSRYNLNGLTLAIKFEGDMYDFTGLQVQGGFFDDATKTLTFNSSGVPDFNTMRPGQTGVVSFEIPLKPGLVGSGGAKTFFVKATAKLSTTNVPSGLDGSEVFATDSIITKISSQPSLMQALLYDNGAGSGPLPPKVGQETVVTVRWQLTNPGNDVRNTKITTTLPPGVSFKNAGTFTAGGAPTFNGAANQVTWNIGTLMFGTGNGVPRAEATFQVAIHPSSNQAGQSIPVMSGTTLSGTDSFTGQAVEVRLTNATTDNIEGHSDDGRVTQ